MIDIHCHIIYGVDDGPTTLEESLKIIEHAKTQGINEMIATSHFIEDGYKVDTDEYISKLDEIKKALLKNNIDMKLYVGNEIMISPDIIKYVSNGQALTLNDSRYVLIELPLNEEVIYLDNILFELNSKGYVPIIAHPERYGYFQKDFLKVEKLKDEKVLFQLDIGSYMGAYGNEAKKLFKRLLKNGFAHFFSSDAHSPHKILDNYSEYMCKLKKYIGEENLEILVNKNPEFVKNNSDSILNLKPFKRKWWSLW